MKKVIVCDPLAEEAIQILKGCKDILADTFYQLEVEELKRIIYNYQGMIVRSQTKVTKEIIEAAGGSLEVIGRAGVGFDNIDVEAATRRGIVVMNVPGGNTISAAEHTMALICAVARNIPQACYSLKRKEWERKKYEGVELYGKVLGIIGLGRIGSEVAKRAAVFGMKTIAYDPYVSEQVAKKVNATLVSFKELLRKSDYITIHTPYTQETKKLISFNEIELMKDGVRIVNCARGGIIDEEALYEGLKKRKVAACALDVFEKEPPLDSPLLELENCIVTPHLGASTKEAQINVGIEIAKQIVDFFTKGEIRNAVNMPSLPIELKELFYPYIRLSEKLGMLCGQIYRFPVQEISLEYTGEVIHYDVSILSVAFLKGFFNVILEEGEVNYINALSIAKERGIKTQESKLSQAQDLVNAIKVTIKDESCKTVIGALKGKSDIRIVKIEDFWIDAVPEGCLIVVFQEDKPGIIGKIGTIFGNLGINIGWLQLSRVKAGGDALSVWNIDADAPEAALSQIRKIKEAKEVFKVQF